MIGKIRSYCTLMRIKHWIKNFIVLIPAFYGGVFLKDNIIVQLAAGFLVFALCSSAIYIINDLCDIEKDRLHPVKCKRPLASGAVSKTEGIVLFSIVTAAALVINWLICGISAGGLIPLLYLLLNFMYSKSWKNKPVIDLVILVSGFVLRMFYGSYITEVVISSWLYLTLIALSLFMAFGKRRNEKIACGDSTRSVLGLYTQNYLNSSMYMYLAIFLVFYALWSVDAGSLPGMIYTTPLVIVMIMRYTYDLESDKHGNPVDVILGDKLLLLLGAVYAAFIFVQIYFPEVLSERIRF
ncbi:MAG: UbiA family prenyltransferase [Ruminococcus sp.]|nr:UbiA family prenyltransferase [Ruminococcus sp.]